MPRKKKPKDEINTNAWMDTYADTITLLLTFFILLYSFSSTDNEKLMLIANALKGEITGVPTKMEDMPDITDELLEQGIGAKNPYELLVEKVNEILEQNGLQDIIEVREEDYGVVLQLSDSILFDTGKAELKADSNGILDVISLIVPHVENEIMIQGHTDNVPIKSSKYESNWELSTDRAITVLKYFIETKGFDPTKFSASGYGEYRPLVENTTDANKAQNRRVEILIMQQKEVEKVDLDKLDLGNNSKEQTTEE